MTALPHRALNTGGVQLAPSESQNTPYHAEQTWHTHTDPTTHAATSSNSATTPLPQQVQAAAALKGAPGRAQQPGTQNTLISWGALIYCVHCMVSITWLHQLCIMRSVSTNANLLAELQQYQRGCNGYQKAHSASCEQPVHHAQAQVQHSRTPGGAAAVACGCISCAHPLSCKHAC